MTLDPDRRDAIRALAVEHADPSPSRPRAVTGRLALASAGLAVAGLAVGVVLIVTTTLPASPEAAPAPVPSASASASAMGPQAEALSGDTAASGTSYSAGAGSALGLLGTWTLTDAPTAGSETLHIDGQSLTVQRDCGQISWQFAASGGLLAVSGAGGDETCFLTADRQPLSPDTSWGDTLRGYRAVEGGWELLDGSGAVAGRLAADEGGGASAPLLDDDLQRMLLSDPAPLGSSWTPATHDDLLGTWTAVGDAQNEGATITFRDGDYVVSDCHAAADSLPSTRQGPAWTGDGRLFVTPTLFMTYVACVPTFSVDLSRVRTIAIADGQLLLFDPAGAELARLERVDS